MALSSGRGGDTVTRLSEKMACEDGLLSMAQDWFQGTNSAASRLSAGRPLSLLTTTCRCSVTEPTCKRIRIHMGCDRPPFGPLRPWRDRDHERISADRLPQKYLGVTALSALTLFPGWSHPISVLSRPCLWTSKSAVGCKLSLLRAWECSEAAHHPK